MRDEPESDETKRPREAAVVHFAGLVLDLDAFTLARESGKAIALTRAEFALLRFFVSHPGRVHSRDALLEAMAGRRFEPFDRSVDVVVGRLRRKIEPDPKEPCLIVTVPGEGYRFDGFAKTFRSARTAGWQSASSAQDPAGERGAEDDSEALADARAGMQREGLAHGRGAGRMNETRKLAAILVADVVGYSRLAGTDEDRTLARLRALRSDLIDPTIALHHGRIVKRTGDGSIIEFRSVVDAVRCAIEVQTGMVERNAGLPPERRIDFRIGIHLGDVVEEADGDLMGDGVNIAARLQAVAKPRGVCLSEDAYRQVKARLDPRVTDLGLTQLKNIAEPIRVFAIETGAVSPTKSAPSAEPPVVAVGAPRAPERRHVIALAAELVPAEGGRLLSDPEDLRAVIVAFRGYAADVLARHGSVISESRGREIAAYFGYPLAQENDAERAVRAALALVGRATEVDMAIPSGSAIRVGVASGLVVADPGGEILGETPAEAGRLRELAKPGQAIVAADTRRRAGELFTYRDLGLISSGGGAGPVQAWEALGPSALASGSEAILAGRLTRMVGREEELALLLQAWRQAKSGEGRLVLLSGEPGIGKSRLLAALEEALGDEPHVSIRYFCSPLHQDSALHPIVARWEQDAGFARGESDEARLGKLEALFASASISPEDVALIATLLSVPTGGRYPPLELSPQHRKLRTFTALHNHLIHLARKAPVLMLLEDAHWADPSSVELLDGLVDRMQELPILLVASYRPEFAPPWVGHAGASLIALGRLNRRQSSALAAQACVERPLGEELQERIIARADGVPLFIEELIKAVLETSASSDAAAQLLAIPSTLHSTLMARLDRLPIAKQVAQIGAAIGREFPQALIAAAASLSDAQLAQGLEELVVSGLAARRGAPPDAVYVFKHALVQDAAYGTLLRESRRALHARIVETLESQFAEDAERQPALLARHCSEAGLIEKAANLWGNAGERSMERSALVEATEQFSRAIDQIASLPSTRVLRREQITLQVALANALMFAKGFAAPETRAALERARLLVEQVEALAEEPPLGLFSILDGFFTANFFRFNGDACRDLAAQYLAFAEKLGKSVPLMAGHYFTGISLAATGDIAEARAHLDRAIALYDPVENRPLGTRLPLDYRVVCLGNRSFVLWSLGFPEAALADAELALRDAREIGHAVTLMEALNCASGTHFLRRDYATAKAVLAEVVSLADEKGAAWYKADGMLVRSLVFAEIKEGADHVRAIASAWDAYLSTGATWWAPTQRSYLAIAYADVGQFDDARKCMGEAFAAAESTKERWFEPEVHRTAGEIELLSPERDMTRAEGHFQRALQIARAQQARSWELRAARSLARLRRDQGKRQEAHDLLAPVYAWFTEGFDTLDLKDAKALLDELAS
jgi:class 3 adenylate cyclase/predicted ATPase